MNGIKLKEKSKSLADEFCIPKAREKELDYRTECIIHEYNRPTKSGYLPAPRQITKLFLALAENEQELAFLAFQAGVTVARIIDSHEDCEEDL